MEIAGWGFEPIYHQCTFYPCTSGESFLAPYIRWLLLTNTRSKAESSPFAWIKSGRFSLVPNGPIAKNVKFWDLVPLNLDTWRFSCWSSLFWTKKIIIFPLGRATNNPGRRGHSQAKVTWASSVESSVRHLYGLDRNLLKLALMLELFRTFVRFHSLLSWLYLGGPTWSIGTLIMAHYHPSYSCKNKQTGFSSPPLNNKIFFAKPFNKRHLAMLGTHYFPTTVCNPSSEYWEIFAKIGVNVTVNVA